MCVHRLMIALEGIEGVNINYTYAFIFFVSTLELGSIVCFSKSIVSCGILH